MIKLLSFGPDVTMIPQLFVRPAVYLDHWAILKFSENDQLSSTFAREIHRTGGALCLSSTSVAELCRATDARHAGDVDRFIGKLMPSVYCTDVAAILLDDEGGPIDATEPPPPNHGMAGELAARHAAGGPGLFSHVWATQRDQVKAAFDEACQAIAGTMQERRSSQWFTDIARGAQVSRPTSRTKLIMGELLRPLFLNLNESITANDAADFQHAMASLLHCDFAVLDGKWADRARSAAQRLSGSQMHVARCFSGRKGGLNDFLSALAATPDHVPLTDRQSWTGSK